eukprot:TRINITY_DN2567_c0_g2_i7.p1 TRINITY_DN2567_c0_g2~~TRINITY_DN2567_c0_g2_i7.p1  ORF type:complete len:366 (-),score=84.12 TRINITY_DN2567_c0_g2_i7:93-1190(-)
MKRRESLEEKEIEGIIQRAKKNDFGIPNQQKEDKQGQGRLEEIKDLHPHIYIQQKGLQIIQHPSQQGATGGILKGIYFGIDVAIKQLRTQSEANKKAFENELQLLFQLHHPNIVSFMGITQDDKIVLEWCSGGDLDQIIHDTGKIFTIGEVINITTQIAKGLAYLHSKNIIHKDIKSRNILLDRNGVPKIADYGLSNLKNSTLSLTQDEVDQPKGTSHWMAPEIFQGEPYNIKADIYSFAVVIWEMLTNEFPFENFNHYQLFAKVGMNGERPDIPQDCPETFSQLIERCWDQEPKSRPPMEDVVQQLEKLSVDHPLPDQSCQCGEKKNVMALPCSHLACCQNCSDDLIDCPRCDIKIEQKLNFIL